MVIADQYFSFGVGPPTRKSTKVSFLGAGGDICNTGRVGSNWSLSRFSSQAVSSRPSLAEAILLLPLSITAAMIYLAAPRGNQALDNLQLPIPVPGPRSLRYHRHSRATLPPSGQNF
ncbi:hypothetical protein TRIATDRAFT_89810 [Trichoderma atroviride IMI 206040]|uniref:Uncharacterized protein n=1 Tax=Hypocrea atroviridis (strain ATCC 20476 / IMI 206040) TaxID=452589 RepID=G9NSN1_HYPAI|nr:uncharacterized protein TRIATDRAFT_89810 [Trichoderma atroviride IMI 206040]EHK46427.1 hypothetical protein TRIATDRAFT_89810 [Trichoderma atroviride IMI 206040]